MMRVISNTKIYKFHDSSCFLCHSVPPFAPLSLYLYFLDPITFCTYVFLFASLFPFLRVPL